MHLILIAIILGLIAFIVLQMSSSQNTGDQSGASDTRTGNKNSPTESVAFISNGKLFHRKPGQDIQQISSPYVQNILDKAERRNELHSWKKGTSFEPRYTGRAANTQTETAAMSFKTAEFIDADTIVYFLSDGKVGGLFEQDLTTGAEKRLLHQQGLDLDHFHYDPDGDAFSAHRALTMAFATSVYLTGPVIAYRSTPRAIPSMRCRVGIRVKRTRSLCNQPASGVANRGTSWPLAPRH